jgi:hypothetical protein
MVADMTATIVDARRQQLTQKSVDLEDARQNVMARGKLGQISIDETNAQLAAIIAKRNLADAELAGFDAGIAATTAVLPITLKVADLADLIAVLEYSISNRTPPPAAIAALDRLKMHLQLKG